MRFQMKGLIVLTLVALIAFGGGAVPAVAVLRVALGLFLIAAFVEILVNMVRHRDMHVRGRLFGMLLQFRR